MSKLRGLKLAAAVAAFLAFVIWIAVRPYGGNVTSLLRITSDFGGQNDLPHGYVLLTDSGFDGMLYHQMARDLPKMLGGEVPAPPRGEPRIDRPYRWQRIMLPALAYAATLGHRDALPWAFLGINVAAVLGALLLMVATTGKADVHALTVALNPAALAGVLFLATEPLSLLFSTWFLFLWRRQGCRVTIAQVGVLSLALLTREVNLFLVAGLIAFLATRRRSTEVLLAASAFVPFAIWQLFVASRFGSLPLASGNPTFAFPFEGCAQMLRGLAHPDAYGLSSLAFLVMFLVPLTLLLPRAWRDHPHDEVPLYVLAMLLPFMVCLNLDLWDAITAIGRVLPVLYPAYALAAADADTPAWRALSASLGVVSVVAGLGLALSVHPYVLS